MPLKLHEIEVHCSNDWFSVPAIEVISNLVTSGKKLSNVIFDNAIMQLVIINDMKIKKLCIRVHWLIFSQLSQERQ